MLEAVAERDSWRQWSYNVNEDTGAIIFEVETHDSYEENHFADYIKFAAYVYGL